MPGVWDFVTGDGLVANAFGCEIESQKLVVKEVSGLKQEFDMIEVKSQTATGVYQLKKIPGRPKPVTVTITRQLTDDMFFAEWMKKIENGATDRRDVIVSVYSPQEVGTAVKRFTIKDCQPSSLEVTQVQAGATNVLDEKVTLQGITLLIEKG
jgi:phage tail-like protein